MQIQTPVLGVSCFRSIYGVFLYGLGVLSAGYINRVWNLDVLSDITVYGSPVEELLFTISSGMYWTSVHEHKLWKELLR